MTRAILVALLAAAILAPAAEAAGGRADVIAGATNFTPSSLGSDASTATGSFQNTTTRAIGVSATLDGQPKCGVDASPRALAANASTDVTFLFDGGCDLSKKSTLTVTFAAGTTPAAIPIALGAQPKGAEWGIVAWSFLAAFVAALALTLFLAVRIRRYNRLAPRFEHGPARCRPPTASNAGDGPIPAGDYDYAVTTVRYRVQARRLPWWWCESAPVKMKHPVTLTKPSAVKLKLPSASDAGKNDVRLRLIYRAPAGSEWAKFRRVGEVRGRDESSFVDGWVGVGWMTELRGLGTNWSLKDNWIANVTLGATALTVLFASSDTFGAVIGPNAKPVLTAMAVAAAIAATLVGIAPLIVSTIGSDLSYTTASGMLFAALVTLVGTLGQVAALTWEVVKAAVDHNWLQRGVVLLGAGIALVVLTYAYRSLWYYVKTGALFVPTPAAQTGLAGQKKHTALL